MPGEFWWMASRAAFNSTASSRCVDGSAAVGSDAAAGAKATRAEARTRGTIVRILLVSKLFSFPPTSAMMQGSVLLLSTVVATLARAVPPALDWASQPVSANETVLILGGPFSASSVLTLTPSHKGSNWVRSLPPQPTTSLAKTRRYCWELSARSRHADNAQCPMPNDQQYRLGAGPPSRLTFMLMRLILMTPITIY